MTAVLNAALAYAARGWPVFPCDPEPDKDKGSKKPLIKNGFLRATTDERQIRDWWGRWPDALIGLPTGPGLGAFVVDLDPRDADCDELWRRLTKHTGAPLGAPIVASTQSGGWHLYYAWPELAADEKLGNRAGLIANVDVRGEGGYVIAPPSVMRNGRAYKWRDGDQHGLQQAPQELLDCILRRGRFAERGAGSARRPQHGAPSERMRKYALSAMDREVRRAEAAVKGERNQTLNEVAFALGQLVGAGALVETVVRSALQSVASAWPNQKKSFGTIESGLKAGIAEPRDLSVVERQPDRFSAGNGRSPPPPPDEPSDDAPPSRDGGGDDGGLPPEKLARCVEYELSDTGNAYRLQEWFGDELLHVHGLGWHGWDGRRWEFESGIYGATARAQETAQRIHAEASELALTPYERTKIERLEAVLRGEATPEPDDKVVPLRPDLDVDLQLAKTRLKILKELIPKRQRERVRHAVNSGNAAKVRGTLDMAEHLLNVSVDDVDAEKLAINVRNGTLRVVDVPDPECPDPDTERTIPGVRLDPHNPEDRITKLTACSYDPGADAPMWRAFLERFLPDESVRRFVQTFYGYGLTGLTSAQVFLFHYGSGANGKSTFMEALRRLMGDYARVLQAEAVTGEHMARSGAASPEFARLGGARFVQVSELPKGARLKEETMKLITGGDPMTVRYLMKDPFELIPEFKASLTGNSKPPVTGSDYAVFRRLRLIHWRVRIDERDKRPMNEVLAEFEAEADGILNWLIEGLLRFRAEGLRTPAEVLDATEEYRADMDPVGEFVSDCVQRKEGNEVGARHMYEAYILWCEASAIRPFSEKRFASEASAAGLSKTKSRLRKYKDVILHNVPSKMDDGQNATDAPSWMHEGTTYSD